MDIKHWLYFGLGTMATIPFVLRSLSQWFLSEYQKKSHVTLSFWVLSTIGNVLMIAHYLIQIQYHLLFIRFFPFYFAIRQMALIQKKHYSFSWSRAVMHLSTVILLLTILFIARVYIEHKKVFFISNPTMPWENGPKNISPLWHLFGFTGATLFTSRMWVQWWQSEKLEQSVLSPSFWWISLIGSTMTLTYALVIQDLVTASGYCLGIIPYVRNLILLKKSNQQIGET